MPPMPSMRRDATIPVAVRLLARKLHIAQSPSASIPLSMDVSELIKDVPQISGDGPFPKTPKFDVLGTPASLLNIALPASATLFTRRGTLVGVNGELENVTSTLSMLTPTVRALVGIPFLYQKITSTTPLTALITSKSSSVQTTFAVISMDGRVDWTIAQRNALLAWTGSTLTVKPKLVPSLSLSRWGNTVLSGRGEIALVGKGQIYQVTLQDESDEFAVHPAHILAYTSNLPAPTPTPYRLRHSRLKLPRLQVPESISQSYRALFRSLAPATSQSTTGVPTPARKSFLAELQDTSVVRFLSRTWDRIVMALRTAIWGDELLFKFKGPCTLLIQSRAPRLSDVIPASEMIEAARIQPKAFAPVVTTSPADGTVTPVANDVAAQVEDKRIGNASKGGHLKVAEVKDGEVTFRSVDSFNEFIK
ncbi:mitochondrial biogenesis AIM24-domain-containing protein [Lipomyces kononenkoae]|uniref:Mitochondrial biogenesis AIM24-domain-containing protein n=1 Tax=Lipomyces kononenkoae TaxID=34357 RepID=A0ACC3SV45_LIPKO